MESVIFIPGLGTRLFDQSVESFAYRFKKALDINDIDPDKQYETEFRKISFGKDRRQESNVAVIFTLKDGKREDVYEIYELEYGKALVDKFEKKNIIIRVLMLFAAIIFKVPGIIYQFFSSLFRKRGKKSTLSFRGILQFTYAAFVLLVISVFGLILIVSLISYLPDILTANSIPIPPQIQHFILWFRDLINAKFVILASTLIMLFLPNVKNFLSIIATEYVCTIYYLNFGERRQSIIGKLEELAENVVEHSGNSNLSIYSLSFGSIIACDALFPQDGRPSLRLASAKTLVTIGSPIDFINAYWPYYFESRTKSVAQIKCWYNIYSMSDILSSNFRYDDKEMDAQYSIADSSVLPTNITYNLINSRGNYVLGLLFLGGLRANQLYWDEEVYSASCLTNLVLKMKEDGVVEN